MFITRFYVAILFISSCGSVYSENVSTQINAEEAGRQIVKTQFPPFDRSQLDPKQASGDGISNNVISDTDSGTKVKSAQVELPFETTFSGAGRLKAPKSIPTNVAASGLESDESFRVIDIPQDDGESTDVVDDIEPISSPPVDGGILYWPATIVLAVALVVMSALFGLLWRASSNMASGFKKSNYMQLRAYLSVRAKSIHLRKINNSFSISLEIQNYGQTPAHKIDIASSIHVLDHPIPDNFFRPEMNSFDKKSYLLPGGITQIESVSNSQVYEELLNTYHYGKTKQIYVFAYAGYQDVDGKNHFTLSCHTMNEFNKCEDVWTAKFEEVPVFNSIGSLKESDLKNNHSQVIYSRVINSMNKT
jgi:hypothetical protein